MKKKKFYWFSWKEVGYLLIVDFAILAVFAYWNISQCYNAKNVLVISPQIICPYYFLTNISDMTYFFIGILVINFALSGIWRFLVKAK